MLRQWNIAIGACIDSSRKTPLYLQIVHALIRDIETGRLTSGIFLPSSRELAGILKVNRKTVVLAYEELIAQGWLSAASTRGTIVSKSLPLPGASVEASAGQARVDEADYRYFPAPERPLALPYGDGFKLDEGAPDGRLFSTELLTRAYRIAIRAASRENRLQYRDPRGSERLRDQVTQMLRNQRGLRVGIENICITRGSQHAIFLSLQLLIKPGDHVIVEELSYEPVIAVIEALGGRVLPVGLDADGVRIDEVEDLCRRYRVRAMFLTPHHQFPTTISLRPERRLRLLELARRFGFAIIEDDYDHEFHFESQPLLPMAANALEQVLYVGSLSKLLLPALRIGYVAAPARVVEAMAHRVSLSDGMGNTLTEDAVAEIMRNGELRRHARKSWQVFAKRRLAFADKLRATFGDRIDFSMPDGGLAFWVRFSQNLDEVEERAHAKGLRFASHRSFMVRDSAPKGLRLGFASLTEQEASYALDALFKAVDT
ncbi:MAG: GntR family transcriptional regulator [Alphaproteobacteria bacterium]|nr:MAG: GntR family transcriptional regulator [Alphaproteobacteria bacterium]